jgi:hypothetical protein
MRRILAFSVLACLAASPAFAGGQAGRGGAAGGGNGLGPGNGAGIGTGAGTEGHGEGDARGGFGGQTEAMRWDDELGCAGITARCR